jgi:hypothetical protein
MPRDARAQRNAEFFRNVNDQIKKLEADGPSRKPIAFAWRVRELRLSSPGHLTLSEYVEIRSVPGRFFTARGTPTTVTSL